MVVKRAEVFIPMSKLSILLLFLLLAGCESSVEQSPVPNVPVDIEVNLNDIDNVALQFIGGHVYINGGADACAIVEVHSSGFYIEDPCCESVYDLSGFPTGGPANYPLKEYRVSLIDDLLLITN